MKINEFRQKLKEIDESLIFAPYKKWIKIMYYPKKGNEYWIEGPLIKFDPNSKHKIRIYDGNKYAPFKGNLLPVISLVTDFMETPVEERGLPNRYYYRYKNKKGRDEYLVSTYNADGTFGPYWDVVTDKSNYNTKNYANSFSEEEYENLRKRAIKGGSEIILLGSYNINNFEKVEVEE